MAYRFEFAPQAIAQANAVYEWIAERSPAQAIK
jgi:hypothetical protein